MIIFFRLAWKEFKYLPGLFSESISDNFIISYHSCIWVYYILVEINYDIAFKEIVQLFSHNSMKVTAFFLFLQYWCKIFVFVRIESVAMLRFAVNIC